MLEVKADLLYKDHISSSPASRQGDVTYAVVGMFFLFFFALCCLLYRTAQHKTGQRCLSKCLLCLSFMLSFISLALLVISIIHITYSS